LERPSKGSNTHKGNYYPVSARREHHEGTTIVAIIIGSNGHIDDISVIESSGYDELDKATADAFRTLHFEHPATLDGKAVRVITYQRVQWGLH
jgi:protein TonB